jgi:hypothetical protein
VIDAADLAARPRETLQALCAALGIGFDAAMLAWPAGPRPTDGVWAKHWYGRVWASTGFDAGRDQERVRASAAPAALPPRLEALAARCQTYYHELAPHRLAP